MTLLVAFDFETHRIDENNIFPKPVCVSSFNGRDAFLYRGFDEMREGLKIVLSSHTAVAHNLSFECGVIYYHFPELRDMMFKALEEGRLVCTKINEQLNSVTQEKPKNKFDLASLVLDYFKEDISDTKTEDSWRLRYNELEGVKDWPQEAIDYALGDSIWAYKLFCKQRKMAYELSVKSEVYLNLMASTGMAVDRERVDTLEREVDAHLKPHYDFLISKDMCELKKGKVTKKVKSLKDYIVSLGVDLRYTKKGGVAVDAESIEVYLGQKQDDILQAFRDIAVYEKAKSAYINRMKGADTIYTSYSTVKNTGRTSSSGSKFYPSLNVQQMPREVPKVSYDIRNCFIPRPGKKIVSIDYAGLELCSTAHQLYKYYGWSKMRDTLNEGVEPTDMHSKLAARIKGVSYEEFLAHKKEWKPFRQLAKPINLGFPGGIGYDTMRHQLWQDGISTVFNVLHTEKRKQDLNYFYYQLQAPDIRIARINKNEWALVQDELVKLKRDFFDLYPELEMFLKESHKKFLTKNTKWVKNDFDEWEEEPMYKYDIYGFKRDWCTYTAFCNGYLMQTPSAIGAKKAVNKTMFTFHDNPDITPLAFIHDEILYEVTEGRYDLVEQAAWIMVDEMQSVLNSVRITTEASVMDQWQKADGFWTKQFWRDSK